jgi:hypothetical protein
VIEVAVAEEDVRRPFELGRAAADVEGEARRVDAKPGRVAGPRGAFEGQLAETEPRAQLRVTGRVMMRPVTPSCGGRAQRAIR